MQLVSGAYHFHTASIVLVILFLSLLVLVLSVWHKCIEGIVIKTSGDCVSMCFEESLILQFEFHLEHYLMQHWPY